MKTPRQTKTCRRGVSLIETLVIVSAASTILTLTGLLIHRTMQASSRTQAFHADEAVAWRLSAQLRADAIGANRAEIAGDSLTLHTADGSSIRYDCSTSTVQRAFSTPDESVVSTAYPLHNAAGWQLKEAENPRRLTLLALPPRMAGPGRTGAPLQLRVTIRLPEEARNTGGPS